MNTNSSERPDRSRSNTTIVIIAAAVAVVVLLAFFLLRPEPEPEPIPEPGIPLESVEPAASGEERGDTAREIIANLNAGEDGPDYSAAHARAREFQAAGHLADAQLLYFFAARGGFGPAAFDLAAFNDPTQRLSEPGLTTQPDPFQAYRWYTAARDAGDERAAGRLEALRDWAESASASGDTDAERLLLQWELER